jgi:hypothetical protein
MAGPGGAYTPSPDAAWHLLAGDDAALPAIAVSLARVPAGVPVFAIVEVDGPEHRQPLESPGELTVVWLDREAGPGEDSSLQLDAVRALDLPGGSGHAFVHGEATAVRLLRRHLLVERGLPADSLSASGYWKLRRTDEEWRAEKRKWIAQAEADLAPASWPGRLAVRFASLRARLTGRLSRSPRRSPRRRSAGRAMASSATGRCQPGAPR